MIDLQGHRFEVVCTLVSEIYDNVDIVMGIQNVYEIEGVISTRDLCLYFVKRSIPLLPSADILLKPREQRIIKSMCTL